MAAAEAVVRCLEGVELEQGAQLEVFGERLQGMEATLTARDATIHEKATALIRAEAQLAQAQLRLTANAQTHQTHHAHQAQRAQRETLQRTIQGLNRRDGAARS